MGGEITMQQLLAYRNENPGKLMLKLPGILLVFTLFSPGETISLEFYTSDNPGEYTILLRGISPDGKILEGHSTFAVE